MHPPFSLKTTNFGFETADGLPDGNRRQRPREPPPRPRWPQSHLKAAVRRRRHHDPVLVSPRATLPKQTRPLTACRRQPRRVRRLIPERSPREELRNEKLTNNATVVANPPDTATDRDSRLPPSNHTRTCNKLPDVYM